MTTWTPINRVRVPRPGYVMKSLSNSDGMHWIVEAAYQEQIYSGYQKVYLRCCRPNGTCTHFMWGWNTDNNNLVVSFPLCPKEITI